VLKQVYGKVASGGSGFTLTAQDAVQVGGRSDRDLPLSAGGDRIYADLARASVSGQSVLVKGDVQNHAGHRDGLQMKAYEVDFFD
jgi:hypothetical protein